MSEIDTMFNKRDPSYDNRTIANTLKMLIWIATNNRDVPENKVSSCSYGLWCGFKWEPHHTTSHLRSRLESQHQSLPGCAEEYGDLLVRSGGRWQTLGEAVGLDAGPHVKRVLWLCNLLSLAPLLSRPEPVGLLRLVIRREHHQHDLPQHQSQPDRRHPPIICRTPTGACEKGMLPVSDPYRGGDWGWRRLHYIDVSSTT